MAQTAAFLSGFWDSCIDDTMQITDFSQVDVIHSTKGGTHQEERWNVQKGLWDDLGDTSKNSYQLRRLSVEN